MLGVILVSAAIAAAATVSKALAATVVAYALLQVAYNAEHGIDPQTVRKKVSDILEMVRAREGDYDAAVPGARGRRSATIGSPARRSTSRSNPAPCARERSIGGM